MDGVVSGRGAAFGGSAEPPPESDKYGGDDDEQAQGYPRDRHDVVGLHRGRKRRWARRPEYLKKKNKYTKS